MLAEKIYSRMRERSNGVDEPETPQLFLNEIRTAIKNDR